MSSEQIQHKPWHDLKVPPLLLASVLKEACLVSGTLSPQGRSPLIIRHPSHLCNILKGVKEAPPRPVIDFLWSKSVTNPAPSIPTHFHHYDCDNKKTELGQRKLRPDTPRMNLIRRENLTAVRQGWGMVGAWRERALQTYEAIGKTA